MFSSFEHSREVSFQIPSTTQQQQDHHNRLTSVTALRRLPTGPFDDHKLVPSQQKPGRKRSCNNLQQQDHHLVVDCDDENEKKKKRLEHREIERRRRQEMANLCSSLRSLLPLDFIKGRRSTSEHMNQVVNYIKHLEENIKGLETTRDELKKTCPHVTDSSSVLPNKNIENETSGRHGPNTVTVGCSHGGVEILIKSCTGFPISRVVKALVQEGLNVISCNSTKVNERFIHSIHSEVSDEICIQVSILQKKLVELVLS
ncbi:transcription factor bHLH36-like [Cynara cardunculus var. scolymus]|uniref:Myc-type, basic helix-loop-helix (BHLH) domain-containing protein n=1 Tax=Cynara cardunculus var. scolymus TaxID=59895 RepID=A0A103YJ71_CYNCS|nr:transcription factor bHLH36-like [Cynara cardunculus var. scolymus]KVI10058.1 Myc-type, basic helix-loop-helix (bHLH) domain-containing protein [Cynara cardunculus var. scolymus]